jgi:general secretion pathway protein G
MEHIFVQPAFAIFQPFRPRAVFLACAYFRGTRMHTSCFQPRRRALPRLTRGFTLIEILVVVVIIGILAALVAPQVFGKIDEARVVKARQDIRAFESALDIYRLDNFRYPTTDQGLQALVTRPTDAKNWRAEGYVKQLMKDPWGNEYQYVAPGTRGGAFDLYSLGRDGAPGGEDVDTDIGNWEAK